MGLDGNIDTALTRASLSGAVDGHVLAAITLTAEGSSSAAASGKITPSPKAIFIGGTH